MPEVKLLQTPGPAVLDPRRPGLVPRRKPLFAFARTSPAAPPPLLAGSWSGPARGQTRTPYLAATATSSSLPLCGGPLAREAARIRENPQTAVGRRRCRRGRESASTYGISRKRRGTSPPDSPNRRRNRIARAATEMAPTTSRPRREGQDDPWLRVSIMQTDTTPSPRDAGAKRGRIAPADRFARCAETRKDIVVARPGTRRHSLSETRRS